MPAKAYSHEYPRLRLTQQRSHYHIPTAPHLTPNSLPEHLPYINLEILDLPKPNTVYIYHCVNTNPPSYNSVKATCTALKHDKYIPGHPGPHYQSPGSIPHDHKYTYILYSITIPLRTAQCCQVPKVRVPYPTLSRRINCINHVSSWIILPI